MKRLLYSLAIAAIATIAFSDTASTADGLPRGQHTATPKYWPKFGWHVTNYTPIESRVDLPIVALTAGTDGDLWYGVAASLEHIDRDKRITSVTMPHQEWTVSGISVVGRDIWFSTGQSGKIGVIDNDGTPRFVQAVARRFNPDIWDLIGNEAGEVWFVDAGRSSIGYRSASGRVVENPFPPDDNPVHMAHCMGKLWVVTAGSSRYMYSIDDDLRPHPFFFDQPRGYHVQDAVCDSIDRLWLVVSNYQSSRITRFDAVGRQETVDVPDAGGGELASDYGGGVWFSPDTRMWPGLPLIHLNRDMEMTRRILPVEIDGGNPITADAEGRIWLAVDGGDSPIAVTELDTR
jgi:hypothetical protein